MTSRHGFSHVLRSIRTLTRPHSISQPFHTSLRLHSTSKEGDEFQPSPAVPSQLSEQIRILMRSTPHSLTTIVAFSTVAAAPKAPTSKPCALLVSSFNTITLHPTPYVSFNIKTPSSTYDAIKYSKHFLASGVDNARVAHAFVKRPQVPGKIGKEQAWKSLVDRAGKLKQGGMWWMQCRLVQEKCAQLGDHVVVVGEVLRAGEYEGNKGPGVIYVNGEYREVGEVVEHNGMTASGLVLPYMDGTDRPIGEVVDPNDEVAKGVGMILVDEKWRKAGKIVEDEEVEDW